MNYTEEQKMRAIKKFTKAYGKHNVIEKNDQLTRPKRELALYRTGFEVIRKFGMLNEYYIATGDSRAKRKVK